MNINTYTLFTIIILLVIMIFIPFLYDLFHHKDEMSFDKRKTNSKKDDLKKTYESKQEESSLNLNLLKTRKDDMFDRTVDVECFYEPFNIHQDD